jgi:penicillin-binding protein 1C
LALPLGGAEISMDEVAELYLMLANDGVMRPLRMDDATREVAGVRLLSAEASFITRDMLRHNPRPDADGTIPVRTKWPVAWKTGTSWGFRDAWSAGIVGPYVLVVWIGNFDGSGNPAFVGIDAAAPLFFRVADALNTARVQEEVASPPPPAGVARVTVCVGSGDLPNADCPRAVDTWYIPGKSPIRVSQLHRTIAIDGRTGQPTCPPYSPTTRFESFEFWSSDMLALFRRAGMPRQSPPKLPSCIADDQADAPRIGSPLRNVAYSLHGKSARDSIALEAAVAGDVKRVYWFDGPALITSQEIADGSFGWRPTSAGVHLVRVVDDHGRSDERDVEIEFSQR